MSHGDALSHSRHKSLCKTRPTSTQSLKKLSFRTHAFLQDVDNIVYRNQNSAILFIQRNVPAGYHKGSILNVWLFICLHIQDSNLRERREWKVQRGREQKGKEMENAGCAWLCLCIWLSSPQMHQYHMEYISGVRDKGHFMWGEKEKAYRTKEHSSTVFSVCCMYAFMAEGR